MSKQTAVQWLVEQLQAPCRGIPSHIIEQAEAMERKQSEYDFLSGYKHGLKPMNHDVIDNYYKETYGK